MTVVFKDLKKFMELTKSSEYRSKKVGFVPTMGALHEGHASLIQKSISENDITVVSIFINPTQFNNPGDLQNYPVTLVNDLGLCRSLGVNYCLMPKFEDLYADNYRYRVEENELSKTLCGAHRAGHFTGVLTVVLKLLNLVRADKAYFGEKDYQQLLLVKGMAEAFFLATEIIACPTVRENDGLAMSSRNLRLSQDERANAVNFPDELKSQKSPAEIRMALEAKGFSVDYIEEKFNRRFGAATLGKVRLIDNVPLP